MKTVPSLQTYPAVTLRDTFVLWSDSLTTIIPAKGCGVMCIAAALVPVAHDPALFAGHWKLTRRMIDSGILLEPPAERGAKIPRYSFSINALHILECHQCFRRIKDCPTRICPDLIAECEPARQESLRRRDGLARLAESIIGHAVTLADENRKERQYVRN